ncbi:hypothetical protein MC50_018595 [Raoultella planticola]|nr:hypothetical protein MC50_018595 [Raoultella planticola]PNK81451.1 hypothetical protein CEP62_026885 [Raoultella planticola]
MNLTEVKRRLLSLSLMEWTGKSKEKRLQAGVFLNAKLLVYIFKIPFVIRSLRTLYVLPLHDVSNK